MASHRLTRLTLAQPASPGNDGTQAADDLTASTSTAASAAASAAAVPGEQPELYDSVRNSRTVEDFTRFVSELRLNRQASRSTLPGTAAQPASNHAAAPSTDDSVSSLSDDHHHHHHHHHHSHNPSSTSRHYDDDNASILDDVSIRYGFHHTHGSGSSSAQRTPVSVRCTCCCNKPDCERATRAMSEWATLEEDLRLAAEIGQSLLHKHDAALGALSKAQDEHIQQRDSLMNRLTHSIRESASLQRQLAQTTLNLEAADASNRTLLSELDEARSASKTLRRSQARLGIVEKHLEKLTRELDDVRAEATAERRRAETAEGRANKLGGRIQSLNDKLDFARREAELMAEKAASPQLGEDAIREARERLQLSLTAAAAAAAAAAEANGNGANSTNMLGEDDPLLIELRAEVDSLTNENARLKDEGRQASAALDAAREEVSSLRESLHEHNSGALSVSPLNSARRTLQVGPSANQLRKASGASISTAFSDTYSIPVSRGSAADRSELGEAEHRYGQEEEDEGDGTSMMASTAPVALSDEVVTRDLEAPAAQVLHRFIPPTISKSTSSDAGSVVTDSTNRGGDGGGGGTSSSMIMSPTTTSASTFDTSVTPTDEGAEQRERERERERAPSLGMIVGIGGSTSSPVKKAPSIQSQGSVRHQRSESVTSSLRGGGVELSSLPGGNAGAGAAGGGGPSGAADQPRDTRTAQLSNLLEYVTRIYNRLVSADIDTLHRRLQRQHLAGGDVGHLARTTVNSIVRDVDALRAHFRKLTEAEQRAMLLSPLPFSSSGANGGGAESLVVRRDFFALLKVFQNLFAETARLRACVNEIHLAPNGASRILNEHLGLSLLGPGEVGGAGGAGGGGGSGGLMGGGWLARMLGTGAGAGAGAGVGSGTGTSGLPVTPGLGGPLGNSPFGPGPGPSPSGATAAAGSASPIMPTLGTSRTPSSASVLSTPTGEGPVPLPNVNAPVRSATGREGGGPRAAALAVVSPSTVAVEVKASASRAGTSTSPMPSTDSAVGLSLGAGEGQAVPRPNPNLGRSTLTRTQSRNLSGIFVGAGGKTGAAPTTSGGGGGSTEGAPPSSSTTTGTNLADESWDVVSQADAAALPSSASQRHSMFFRSGVGAQRARPLSRIVDDDELSVHQGRRGFGGGAGTGTGAVSGTGAGGEEDDYQRFTSAAARANTGTGSGSAVGGAQTLRRRGLSDSSMHSTFLEGEGAGGVSGRMGGAPTGAAARAGGGHSSAAGLLVRGAAGGGGGNGPMGRSPMARIITPATLSLHVSSSASGRTSAQFARSMSTNNANSNSNSGGKGGSGSGSKTGIAIPAVVQPQQALGAQTQSLAPSSPSISEGSGASFSTGGAREKQKRSTTAGGAAGPRGLMPSLRAAPSAVALLFPGAGAPRTASASSSVSAAHAEAGVSSMSPGKMSPGKGASGGSSKS